MRCIFFMALFAPFFIFAQTPINDDCTGAISLTIGDHTTAALAGTSTSATAENGTPCSLDFNDKAVWYTITNGSTAQDIEIVTEYVSGTSFRPYISVLGGACGQPNLTCVSKNTSISIPGGGYTNHFAAAPNTTYYIAVYDESGDVGDFTIKAYGQPANDECAGVVSLTSPIVGGAASSVTSHTYASNVDPDAGCNTGSEYGGVWYKFTAGANATYTASTLLNTSTIFDTRLTVFTGSCGGLTCVATNNNQVGYLSELNWYGTSGTEYYILVDGQYNTTATQRRGIFTLDLTAATTASNDHCENAVSLTIGDHLLAATAGSSTTATTDNYGTPCSLDFNDKAVWYTITNGSTAQDIEIVTEYVSGTSFRPYISVLGGACGQPNLTCVSKNTSISIPGGGYTNHFAAAPNTTYYIAVYDESGDVGDFTIKAYGQPANDECAAATVIPSPTIGGAATTVNGHTFGSNIDTEGGCSTGTSKGGVWYKLTASATTTLTASTLLNTSPTFDTRLSVFTGTCGTLTCIATNNNQVGYLSEVNWSATSGTTYYILVDGLYLSTSTQRRGDFRLDVSAPNSLLNDGCASAINVSDGDVISSSTSSATTDNIGVCNAGANMKGVWYSITPRASAQIVELSTCASSSLTNFDADISVYKGSCGTLNCVVSSQGNPNCLGPNMGATVSFIAAAGVQYYVLVGNDNGAQGNFQLTVSETASNDDCVDAFPLTVDVACFSSNFTSNQATSEAVSVAPNPTCGFYQGGDVWFTAVVPASGNLRIEVADISGINAQYAVYTGTCSSFSQYSCKTNGNKRTISDLSLANTTIYIRVYNYNNSSGGDFSICVWEPIVPSNDNCANATQLSVGASCVFSAPYDYEYITSEPLSVAANPTCGNYVGGDVWFKFTMPASGRVRLELDPTVGGNVEYALYSGSCGAFTQEVCKTFDTEITLHDPSLASDELHLRVWLRGSSDGGEVKICVWEPPLVVNDYCNTAITLPVGNSCSFSAPYNYKYATSEPTSVAPNPSCGAYVGGDMWFKFTMPSSGRARLELDPTIGASVEYAVYSGSCGNFNQEFCRAYDKEHTFHDASLANTDLYLRVWLRSNEDGGEVKICVWEPPLVVNDYCNTAITLPVSNSCSFSTPYNYEYATSEPTSVAPNPSCGAYVGGDMWFKFTMPSSGRARLELDPTIGASVEYAVYSGSCGNFNQEFCRAYDKEHTFHDASLANTDLYLRVWLRSNEDGGEVKICVWEPPLVVNDYCNTAITLPVSNSCSFSTPYNYEYATSEPTSVAPNPSCGAYVGGDMWFKFTMPSSGRARLELDPTIGASVEYAVYSGSCGNFNQEFCRAYDKEHTFHDASLANTDLYLRVWLRSNEDGGEVKICLWEPPIQLNEACESALDLNVGTGVCSPVQYTNAYTISDDAGISAPSCGAYKGGSVWFKATVPASGNLTTSVLSVSGAPFANKEMQVLTSSTNDCNNLDEYDCISSGSPIGNNPMFIESGLTPGDVIYFRIFTFDNEEGGEFEICAYDQGFTLHTWNGSVNADWFNAANWSASGVPTNNGVATIPTGLSNYPIIDGSVNPTAACLSLDLETSTSLDVVGNAKLNVGGDIVARSQLTFTAGTLAFVGVQEQSVIGIGFPFIPVQNLEINAVKVNVNIPIEVTGVVHPIAGELAMSFRELLLKSSGIGSYAQIAKGSGTITGNNIKVERVFSTTEGWRQIALPVSASVSAIKNWTIDLSGTSSQSMFWWDASDAGGGVATGWTAATASNNNLNAYTSYVSTVDNPITNPVFTKGEYVTGDQNYVIYNTQDPNDVNNVGWNFIPNPYATNLNLFNILDDYLATGSSNSGDYPLSYAGAHIWDGGTNVTGQYVTIINSVSVNTGNAGFDALSPFSSFWVKMEPGDGASQPFVIRDAHRDNTASSYNSLKTKKEVVRLNYHNGMGRFDEAALYLELGATDQFNPRKDAYKLLNNSTGEGELFFHIPRDGKLENTVIKSINPQEKIDTISLGLIHNQNGASGEISINLSEYSGHWQFGLWDSHLNIVHDLRSESYKFIQSDKDNTRLFIIYANNDQDIFRNTNDVVLIDIYGNSGDLFLLSTTEKVVEIQISDLAGRLIYQESNVHLQESELQILPTGLVGVHLVRLVDAFGNEQNVKIIF